MILQRPADFYDHTFRTLTIKVVIFSPPFRLTLQHFCSSSFFCFSLFIPTSFRSFTYPLFSLPQFDFPNCLPFPDLPSLLLRVRHRCKLIGSQLMKCGPKGDFAVLLYINVDGNTTKVVIDSLCVRADNSISTLLPQVQNHFLAYDIGCDLIAMQTAVIVEAITSHAYPYSFPQRKRYVLHLRMCTRLGCTGWKVKQ